MSSNSGAPLFQFNNNRNSKESLFAPPASNVTSNGLFSAQSTPESNRFLDSPDSRSLFAGATPGAKSGSKAAGSLFSAGGKPTFNLGPMASAGPSSSLQTSSFGLPPPKAIGTTGMFGEGESTEIYEDDSRDEDMEQDEDESGMYGDEEEEDYTEEEESSVMEESSQPGNKPGPYDEMIGPPATEPGALIIKAEELMEELERLMSPSRDDEYDSDEDMDFDMDRRAPSLERQQEYLGKASKDFLTALHAQLSKSTKAKADRNLRYAYYIASLILPLHHATSNTTEVLRKWIFTHHPEPSRSHLTSVRGTHPNSALSVDFWDVVYRLTIRGEVQEAAEVLRSANWDFLSEDAPPISQPAFGAAQKLNDKRYPQAEIESIKTAVATAISLLERCPGQGRSAYQPSSQFFPMAQPAVDHPGTPADWRIWRGEVLKASEEIKGIAMEDDDDPEETYYDAYNPQTGRGGSFGFARASKPKMKVPSAISRHLRAMYDVMRGDQDAITSTADNWQEATVSLMMWAKDADSAAADEEEEFEDNVAHHSQNMNPGEYYSVMMHRKKRQLAQLSAVMDIIAEEIPPNPTDRLETAICGVLANDPLYIAELEKYSSLVAATIVEIGGWAGWIKRETTPKDNIANGNNMGLDEDDFAILGMGAVDNTAEGKLAEDAIRRWGSRLFGTEWIDEDAEVEGWEIGIGPIARTKDGRRLNAKLLEQIPLTSTRRVEKLLTHTTEAKYHSTHSAIAFNWANHLISTTDNHGEILHFLSLAAAKNDEARRLLHDTVTTLLQRSLLSSSAYPPDEILDPRLQLLLSSPTECKSELLRFELSGYAALRTFYTLRSSAPETAVKALTAVIKSAGEPIDGGVWDKEWESPVEPTVLPQVLKELLSCVDALGIREAMDVAKVLTDFEACGDGLRKACIDQGDGDSKEVEKIVRSVREGLCKVFARAWKRGGC